MEINKIKESAEFKLGDTVFEVTIKDEKGDIVYQHKSVGGIITSVEKILDVSNGEIEGVHQIFGWGNLLVQWHGFEQLRMYFKQNMDKFLDEVVKLGGIMATPETIEMLKKKFRERTNWD